MNQPAQIVGRDRLSLPVATPRLWSAVAWSAVVVVAVYYVFAYASVYLFPGSPSLARHRTHTGLLLPHIVGGIVALLLGPLQFVPSIRQKHKQLHRLVGKAYLVSVAVSGLGAAALLLLPERTLGFHLGIGGLALAWFITSGLAYLSIRRRNIEQHREWMIRSYVVTFGFVNFRLLTDGLNAAGVPPSPERATYVSFLCWALPLLIAEAVLQGRKILATAPARVTSVSR